MSEIMGTAVAHEAYAFACMRCGHGWENAYDIEHHVDGTGRKFVVYKCEGARVPSPLSSPSCANCGGHVVRIMRSGQVSSVRALMTGQQRPPRTAGAAPKRTGSTKSAPATAQIHAGAAKAGSDAEGALPKVPPQDGAPGAVPGKPAHHWRLADLLHPFHHRV